MTRLQDSSKLLADKLQNNNLNEATSIINEMVEARNSHIFNAVGQLTRGLHEAIVNFHVDVDLSAEPPEVNKSEIKDASDRLNYVITMTQAAADKTMDKVETVAPIAMNLGEEAHRLKDEWQRLKRKEISKDGFKDLYVRIEDFLDQMGSGTDQLNKNLQDIILEQGYQDLTGQVLTKVIGLITDVEKELVNLMRIAGQVEEVTGLATSSQIPEKVADNTKGEGPQINKDRPDVVQSQDEVDDLLSSLGF